MLVESHRVDGKPRQRVIRHLAAIRDGELEQPRALDRFWQRADAVLDELLAAGTLTREQHQALEHKLSAELPRWPSTARSAR